MLWSVGVPEKNLLKDEAIESAAWKPKTRRTTAAARKTTLSELRMTISEGWLGR
jgi:hypothetical protein